MRRFVWKSQEICFEAGFDRYQANYGWLVVEGCLPRLAGAQGRLPPRRGDRIDRVVVRTARKKEYSLIFEPAHG